MASQSLRLCGRGLHLPPAPLGLLVVLHLSPPPLFSAFSERFHPQPQPGVKASPILCSTPAAACPSGPRVSPRSPLLPQAHLQVPDCSCSLDAFSSPHVFLGDGASFCMGSDSHCLVLRPYLARPNALHGIPFNSQASDQSMGSAGTC